MFENSLQAIVHGTAFCSCKAGSERLVARGPFLSNACKTLRSGVNMYELLPTGCDGETF
jgi:hypothetical protein